jgi:hypothetical protein
MESAAQGRDTVWTPADAAMGDAKGNAAGLIGAHFGAIVFVTGLAAVIVLRVSQLSVAEAPPGADGGDWLAFAYQLAGEHVRAAEAASPPVVPMLLWGLMTVFTPLVALKIVAVIASVAIAVPFYLIVRAEVPPLVAAVLAVVLTLTGYHSETMAWGGYPQLLGAAFLLATLLTLGEGLVNRSRPLLIGSGIFAALTLGTHQLAAAELVLAVPMFLICLAIQVHPASHVIRLWSRHLLLWLATAIIFSLPIVPTYVRIFALAHGNPANPQGYGLTSFIAAAAYAFRDEPLLWTAISVGAVLLCLATIALGKGSRLAASAAALVLSSFLIFASLYEVRAFHIFQIGVFEIIGLGVVALFKAADASLLGGVATWVERLAVVVALIVLVGTLVIRGNERNQDTMVYYRVIDAQSLAALRWLQEKTAPGSLVVAGQTGRDGPYSWWIEGVAKRPAYSTNLKFLHGYNGQEQEQILFATRLLSPSTSVADATQLIRTRHIAYFFIDKAARQQFEYVIESVPTKVVFENREILILAPTTP